METILKRTVQSETETKNLIENFFEVLQKIENFSVFLEGGLGAGKTFFVRELLKKFNVNDTVNSPTYTYVQEYFGDQNFAHFDLYRFQNDEEFLSKGFGEVIEDDQVCKLAEWPKKLSNDLLEEFSGKKFLVKIIHGKKDTERDIKIFKI